MSIDTLQGNSDHFRVLMPQVMPVHESVSEIPYVADTAETNDDIRDQFPVEKPIPEVA